MVSPRWARPDCSDKKPCSIGLIFQAAHQPENILQHIFYFVKQFP
jgi:hypothetical protein